MAHGTVLVLKPSSLGDIVHTLPAVARIRAAQPTWPIAWLVNSEWAPILAGNPDVDEVIEFPRAEFGKFSNWPRLSVWLKNHLAGRRFDLALDFQGLLRSALLARLSGAREIIGLSDAREGARLFYTKAARLPKGPLHAVERYLALSTAAVGESDEPLSFPLPHGAPVSATPAGEFVLIHPFARGAKKSLGGDCLNALVRALAPRMAVMVGRCEQPFLEPAENAVDLINATSLLQLIWLLRCAAFVITVDSGPMHLAAALNRPLLGIHTWTDPRKVGPYRPAAWVWKAGQLFQMRDLASLPEKLLSGVGRMPRQEDLPPIAALVASVLR